MMVNCICNFSGSIVVKMRKGNFILSSYGMSQYDFADIIKLVPVLIKIRKITKERLKFGSSGNCNVECFTCEERFEVKKIIIIFVNNIRKHLICQPV